MTRYTSFFLAALLALPAGQLAAAETPKASPAPATFDPAAIRKRAAQIAEFRALLADPDPAVRLVTMQEAIDHGDSAQRQTAIEAGLASNEAALIDAAMRGVLANTSAIIITFGGKEQDSAGSNDKSLRLLVKTFDIQTGRLAGPNACGGAGDWSGQYQGTAFSFSDSSGRCRGTLIWSGETGDFRGEVNNDYGSGKGQHAAIWKPR